MKFCYYVTTACFLLFVSCKKEIEVKNPSFEVHTSSNTLKVGDVITFNIESNADIITFYSGLRGDDYDFKDTERVYPATTSLSFISAMYAGNNSNCAALKYSTDFNGNYDPASIRQATWTDITDRFHIPGINGSSAVFENSGEKDISDLFPDINTPIYFAWFFTTQANSNRTRFQVQAFQLKGVVANEPDLTSVNYDFASCGFKMVKGEGFLIQDDATTTPRVTASAIIWDGVYATTSFKEGWAVSNPLYAATEVNLGRDYGTAIKSVLDVPLTEHQFKYEVPGTYTVTFVAANKNVYDAKEVVKQIKLNIEP